jgi:alpha-L-fucosidase
LVQDFEAVKIHNFLFRVLQFFPQLSFYSNNYGCLIRLLKEVRGQRAKPSLAHWEFCIIFGLTILILRFTMKKIIASSCILFLFISCNQKPVDYLTNDPFDKEERMAWWEDARFGMFIHWGLYAVPAGEWEDEKNHAEWIRTTAKIPLETYDSLVAEFNPVLYDPEAWVKTAKKAGMKYIVITSKHHDGFCLFDSKHTDFDVVSTPYGKDMLAPLAEACRKEGIKICWYHSIMDWHHPDYLPRRNWETDRSSEGADFDRYIAYMKAQLKELITNYGDIGVLWFDGEWEESWTNEYGKDLYNYVRNLQPGIVINNRVDVGRSGMAGLTRPGEYAGDFGTPEQEIPATGLPGVYWETCMTMNNHWGYNKADNNWKSSTDLIRKLADISSKGGNFLLNVGPKADGTFPDESKSILETIGKWLDQNGDAIYGTQASPFKKLDFGRCTYKLQKENSRFYFHVFNWPENGILRIPGIYNTPLNAFLLTDRLRDRLQVKREEDALLIAIPGKAPDSVNTIVVLDVEGKPDISNPPRIEAENGIFVDLISVNIFSSRENVVVRYTLDGTVPDTSSSIVEGALLLRESALVVARCFRDNEPVSDTIRRHIRKVNPIPSIRKEDVIPGLMCGYYEGTWDSLPDFQSITPVKQISVSEFDLTEREQKDHYGFLFEGFIQLEEDGIYDFYTDSDDGSELYINDRLVVDNDGLHGMQTKKGAIPLEKGFHKIRVSYFEKDGNDALKVFYRGPGFDKKRVPGSVLFRDNSKR